jgi:uncharacterized protein
MPSSGTRPAHRLGPRATQRADRISGVDAIRALALLGVLAMNLHDISGLPFMSGDALAAVQTGFDRAVDVLLKALVEDKALSAFSFLFGLSFTLMLENIRRRGDRFSTLYLRRLAFLAGFGLINAALFYWGDILTTYAVLGLMLILASRLSQRAALVLSGLLLFAVPIGFAILGIVPGQEVATEAGRRALAAFGEPSPWATIAHNVERFLGAVGTPSAFRLWKYTNIMGLFLLGLWAGRARVLHDVAGHRRLLARVVQTALPSGLIMAVAALVVPAGSPVATVLHAGVPVLAVGYVAAAALLLDHGRARALRDALAPAGRMALTVYLMGGLTGQVLFYGWGLGLLGRTGTASVLALAVAVFAGLLLASRAWLAHFRYGPWEWAWRSLTYLSPQPIRG